MIIEGQILAAPRFKLKPLLFSKDQKMIRIQEEIAYTS
jgi:hypothetical protein